MSERIFGRGAKLDIVFLFYTEFLNKIGVTHLPSPNLGELGDRN
jgi:hypothetical protein